MAKSKTGYRHRLINSRVISALAFDAFFVGVIAIAFSVNPLTHAANYSITGGSNGPLCNSGGYFTPNKLTVNSGSTVTISVPANDPYSGGLEVHGFPEGDFTVQNGTNHTTQPLKTNISFYGSWPYTGCTKGSGTITVTQVSPPPPAPPPPSPSPNPTPHPVPVPRPAPTPPPSGSVQRSSPQPVPHPSRPAPQPSPTSAGTTQEPIEYGQSGGAGTSSKTNSASDTSGKLSPQRKAVGFASVVLAAGISSWLIWQLFFRRVKY